MKTPRDLRLAQLLAPAIEPSVRLAIADPQAWVKRHARSLRDRGVTAPFPRLPRIALLDELDARKQVALVDAKSSVEDLAFALRRLKGARRLSWSWKQAFDEDALDDLPMAKLLGQVAVEARACGLSLVNLDRESDQYALTLVPNDATRPILTALGRTGELVRPRPLPRPKARKRRELGAPLARWPRGDDDAPGTWRYFVHRERARTKCLVKWETALRVLEATVRGTGETDVRREFSTEAQTRRAWVAELQQLRAEGWLQFTASEHARELLASG